MNHIIKDIKTVSPELMVLIHNKCPKGRIRKKDLLDLPLGNGKHLKVIEIKTEDTVYLIKVNDGLHEKMEAVMLELEEAKEEKRSRDDMLDDLDKMSHEDEPENAAKEFDSD